jgi:hypothetical protein
MRRLETQAKASSAASTALRERGSKAHSPWRCTRPSESP